jgi:hypothetical protein
LRGATVGEGVGVNVRNSTEDWMIGVDGEGGSVEIACGVQAETTRIKMKNIVRML